MARILKPVTMISIILRVETEEFGQLTHSTWALGQNPGLALANWKRSNPNLALSLVSSVTVTQDRRNFIRQSVGARLPIFKGNHHV